MEPARGNSRLPVASGSDDSAAPAQPVTRVCGHCGKTIRLPPRCAGVTVKCPLCGERLEPGEAEGLHAVEFSERSNNLASAAGWTLSVALHVLVLVALSGMTWLSGVTGRGTEAEVGIVVDDEGAAITPGDDALRFETDAAEPTLELAESVETEPITELGATAAPEETEAIIGIELASAGDAAAADNDWASFASTGGGESAGRASFFGIEAEGGKFVFVLDRSGSMEGEPLQAVKNEITRRVGALESPVEFFIVFYSHQTLPMNRPASLVTATNTNKRRYLQWVERIQSGGTTNPIEAMQMALSLRPDAIWLLSDGVFDGDVTDDRICGLIRAANHDRQIRIHTIAYYDEAGRATLQRIARENNGQYRFVPPPNSRRRR